jgi:cyanophycin synthetase
MARHMVENVLAATGAALGLGYSIEQIAEGLRTFRSDTRSNIGRLNVFRLGGRTIVIDYAHNESGLEGLLEFTARLTGGSGSIAAIIGTAGDRQDAVFRNLGRIAAERAGRSYIKANPKYLRGRAADEPIALMREGVAAAGGLSRLAGIFASELDAFRAALDDTAAGDAIAVMCVEEQLAIYRELRERGAEEWT